jgi:hypothetical protein
LAFSEITGATPLTTQSNGLEPTMNKHEVQRVKAAVFFCDVCGERCGSGMTTFEQPNKNYHACSGFHNMVPCRAYLQMKLDGMPKAKSQPTRKRV